MIQKNMRGIFFLPSFNFEKIGKSRADIMNILLSKGNRNEVHYIPLYRQPYYSEKVTHSNFQGAEAYYNSTLSIPMHHGLRENDV